MSQRPLSEFESEANLAFQDKTLLSEAFVHRSYVNEVPPGESLSADNERLEFLGDAVLEFVVSKYLYDRYPTLREGELTRLRAALVRRETLARVARNKRLGDYLIMGKGEEESGGRERPATLCATYEAVVGALFLDQGLEAVERFVMPDLREELEHVEGSALHKDSKSRLQEWIQQEFGVTPRYRVVESVGPDHAKTFVIEVSVLGYRCGVGKGKSKQEASQHAATMALVTLGQEPATPTSTDPDLSVRWPVAADVIRQIREALPLHSA